MSECLFCAIAAGDIPVDEVYRDDTVVAFRDIAPQAPVHVLVIPRAHHANVAAAVGSDAALVARLLSVAADVADAEGVADDGYRIVTNTGPNGGQSVDHLHFHLLGGRSLAWPPG